MGVCTTVTVRGTAQFRPASFLPWATVIINSLVQQAANGGNSGLGRMGEDSSQQED